MLSASSINLRKRAASVLPALATKLKARKHLATCLATGACALATSLPANASLTFDFSFDVTNGSPINTGTVTGTISGLQDNLNNQTTELTISNLSAPNSPSGGWPTSWFVPEGSTGIWVSNGEIIFYDINFKSIAGTTQYDLFLRFPGSPEAGLNYIGQVDENLLFLTNQGGIVTFTPQSDPGPMPVPGPLPVIGAGAAFGWSRKLRRRLKVVTDAS